MQIGNPAALEAARNALRDQFDAVWQGSPVLGDTELRAARCAMYLDAPRYDASGGWRITPGARSTYSGPIILGRPS